METEVPSPKSQAPSSKTEDQGKLKIEKLGLGAWDLGLGTWDLRAGLSMPPPSLLHHPILTMYPLIKELQRKIEKTYGLDTGIANIERFVIGDLGYKKFYANEKIRTVVNSVGSEARVLIRDCVDTVRVSIYYPDKLISILEENDPRSGIHDDNIDACASFVEELDHFLFIAQNFKFNRPFSLLELELQANITKYLTLKYFIALQNRALRLMDFDKEYICYHLFYKRQYDIRNAPERRRYEDAKRFSIIYTRFIDMLRAEDRLRNLRRFSRMSCASKISYIQLIGS